MLVFEQPGVYRQSEKEALAFAGASHQQTEEPWLNAVAPQFVDVNF